MAGFLTEFVNNKILDCYFGGLPLDPPASLFFGLSLTGAYKGGYTSEPSCRSYARVAVPNDRAHFPGASSGTKTNALAISFPSPLTAWGTISSVFIADSAIAGNVLAMADLPRPLTVRGGDPSPTIAINALFLSHT